MRVGWLALALVVAGCSAAPEADGPDPNAGLLRDLVPDGKFDAAGHPLNARVTRADVLCRGAGSVGAGGVVELTRACVGALAGAQQHGDLVASVRYRVVSDTAEVRFTLRSAAGAVLVEESITGERVREAGEWADLPLAFASDGGAVTLEIAPSGATLLELAYVETFPQEFRLVLSPGSGVVGDDDQLTIELGKDARLPAVELDGRDISARLAALLAAGKVRDSATAYRRILTVRAGDLLADRGELSEILVSGAGGSARAQLLRTAPACSWEGNRNATARVLVTGFRAFPADAWHENVSEVAVRGLRPGQVRSGAVMRLILPVEFDRAAALVAETAKRCRATAIVSFGQGGSGLALEQTAYNLQDTSEVAGGVPDNRGIIAIARRIDPRGPASRASGLPLTAIERALRAIRQPSQRSRDPGRYICNNVFYVARGTLGRAGFVHLPYTTSFTDQSRAHWAQVAETIVQEVAAAR